MTPPATPQPQLLPCPFCGQPAAATRYRSSEVVLYGVEHADQDSQCPVQAAPRIFMASSKEAAAKLWNTRADSAAIQSLRDERDAAVVERYAAHRELELLCDTAERGAIALEERNALLLAFSNAITGESTANTVITDDIVTKAMDLRHERDQARADSADLRALNNKMATSLAHDADVMERQEKEAEEARAERDSIKDIASLQGPTIIGLTAERDQARAEAERMRETMESANAELAKALEHHVNHACPTLSATRKWAAVIQQALAGGEKEKLDAGDTVREWYRAQMRTVLEAALAARMEGRVKELEARQSALDGQSLAYGIVSLALTKMISTGRSVAHLCPPNLLAEIHGALDAQNRAKQALAGGGGGTTP